MLNLKGSERPHKKAKFEATSKPKPPVPKSNSPRAESRKMVPAGVEESKPTAATTTSSKLKGKGKAKEDDPQLPTSFKVVAGSYEKLLYGLDGSVTVDEQKHLKFKLKPIFIFPAHVSCIKAVAASPQGGKWLATGSADEIVKVWDLRRRKEIGGLMHHEGSITHLLFPSRSHLLSASEDGTLCLFRARDWAVLRSLKGHKGRVNAVAVHPSGKVALSVGKDRALRMWDLMRGKGVASTKLGKEGETVRWSIDGTKFVVQSGSAVDVYATNMDLLYTITHPSRIHDVKFCSLVNGAGEVLLVGAEDHKLTVYHIPKDPESKTPFIVAEMIGHTNRVKAVHTLDIALPKEAGRKSTTLVCTVSSDGFVNLYDIASIPASSDGSSLPKPEQIEPLTSYDSKGTRLTCVTLADGDLDLRTAAQAVKRNRDEEDASEDPESSDEDDKFDDNWEGVVDEEVEGEEEGEGDD